MVEKAWQIALREGFSSAKTLLEFLELPHHLAMEAAEKTFKTRVPKGFAACMEKRNPECPILLQVLAAPAELDSAPGFVPDPLQEANFNPVPGLIHKYHGRVLLTVTGVCAVHCRYCFRRHFPYQANNPGRSGWRVAIDYIAANPSIHEVILSGGDPFMASDSTLSFLFDALAAIPHVETLRIHTRVPIVLPERIDDDLCELLNSSRFRKVVVLHANHGNELRDAVKTACVALSRAGCFLLNQSVLLKKVNDDSNTLITLSQRLWACGVLPYYLHLLDKVQGAAHFEVSEVIAKQLLQQISEAMPGYLVPKLVKEVAGGKHKYLVR